MHGGFVRDPVAGGDLHGECNFEEAHSGGVLQTLMTV